MNTTSAITDQAHQAKLSPVQHNFALGIDGFTYADLHNVSTLEELYSIFLVWLKKSAPEVSEPYNRYLREKGRNWQPQDVSNVLIDTAKYVDAFTGMLFHVEDRQATLKRSVEEQKPIFRFKKDFLQRRVWKKYKPAEISDLNFAELQRNIHVFIHACQQSSYAKSHFNQYQHDEELFVASLVCWLMDLEKECKSKISEIPNDENFQVLFEAIISAQNANSFWKSIDIHLQEKSSLVQSVLDVFEKWSFAHYFDEEEKKKLKHWVSYRFPEPLDYMNLVKVLHPNNELYQELTGPEDHLRRRDGFKLTDRRYGSREVLSEADYCVFCHDRDKDSCSKGLKEKDRTTKKNPLGIKLTGCPLDEKISEMHALKYEGYSLGALATIMIDNPMLPGTGHRICNDCMKACIYQKQEPVNIPQIETGVLTDVLNMPYGFEIYSFLTRWNPLNINRPYALPYNGKNILVVGLGPAGYTLSHYLLNEGFGVVGIDGLKIEPLSDQLVGADDSCPKPVRKISEIQSELDERSMMGFGGVSEYGITVRWDKNFLQVIYLTLARREKFKIYGGVRFGGTMTIDDAWDLGFDHIAIATGAGKPTIVNMKNNLSRGIRMASDFLMALQLTGAAKRDSMANLQIQLPAIVIGGGLTAIDTATELMAYYPLQVEKYYTRFNKLAEQFGEKTVWQLYDDEEKIIARRYIDHAVKIKAERDRAAIANEQPDFIPLLREWGGVKIAYRKSLSDSPAYRLNHEEIIKALEEGISFIECVSPVEAKLNAYGAVEAMIFEKQLRDEKGKWRDSGDFVTLPARSVMVAAGTSPNTIIERENPGTFKLDKWNQYFLQHVRDETDSAPEEATPDEIGFFTSYQKNGKYISYYGDNHPVFAGNVVKAMASARTGYKQIVSLYEQEMASLKENDQPSRESAWKKLSDTMDDNLLATIVEVKRYTPAIVDVIIKAKYAAQKFQPGQFYRLQNYEANAFYIDDTKLAMEGLALTGAWVDKEKGLLSMIVLEMGTSSRLCASLLPGQRVVVMGPTGAPTEIPQNQNVLLAGGGLGNAVLFSIARALKNSNCKVIYFAGYKKGEDLYKREEIESSTDQVIWSTDSGAYITPHRKQDSHFRGNIVEAIAAYGDGALGDELVPLKSVTRIIAIGSDRMMSAIKDARYNQLAPYLNLHTAIGSINSPMQCMMKEVCAQCLQRHVDPVTGKESGWVFSCFNQDQELDIVDFKNLNDRLKQNIVLEKLSNKYLDYLLSKQHVEMI